MADADALLSTALTSSTGKVRAIDAPPGTGLSSALFRRLHELASAAPFDWSCLIVVERNVMADQARRFLGDVGTDHVFEVSSDSAMAVDAGGEPVAGGIFIVTAPRLNQPLVRDFLLNSSWNAIVVLQSHSASHTTARVRQLLEWFPESTRLVLGNGIPVKINVRGEHEGVDSDHWLDPEIAATLRRPAPPVRVLRVADGPASVELMSLIKSSSMPEVQALGNVASRDPFAFLEALDRMMFELEEDEEYDDLMSLSEIYGAAERSASAADAKLVVLVDVLKQMSGRKVLVLERLIERAWHLVKHLEKHGIPVRDFLSTSEDPLGSLAEFQAAGGVLVAGIGAIRGVDVPHVDVLVVEHLHSELSDAELARFLAMCPNGVGEVVQIIEGD